MDQRNSFLELILIQSDLFLTIEEIILLKQKQNMEQEIHGDNSDMINLKSPEEILSKKLKENSKIKLSKDQELILIK